VIECVCVCVCVCVFEGVYVCMCVCACFVIDLNHLTHIQIRHFVFPTFDVQSDQVDKHRRPNSTIID